MKALVTLLIAAWLGAAGPACAHRLDEYLQATTVAVTRGHVVLRVRLTPGVAVAPAVLAQIDANGDGALSPPEQAAYAGRVLAGVSLSIDGAETPLRLRAASFSAPASMRAGSGDVLLELEASAPAGMGEHRLEYAQRPGTVRTVRLVNALANSDAAIRIDKQSRSPDQASYALTYAIGRPGPATGQGDGPAVVTTFLAHGIWHILTGYDHLLFVAALALGATTLWDLVKVVTAFTIAHSVTLTLATLGWVSVPSHLVEPLIAASIVFVAVQNLLRTKGSNGLSRLAAAFVFGLAHGLGFAGGLLEIMHAMDRTTVLLAILGFSLGVELGNQLVLLPLFFGLKALGAVQDRGTIPDTSLARTRRIASAAVSIAGAWYLGVALAAA